jgi:hypothetical protein
MYANMRRKKEELKSLFYRGNDFFLKKILKNIIIIRKNCIDQFYINIDMKKNDLPVTNDGINILL